MPRAALVPTMKSQFFHQDSRTINDPIVALSAVSTQNNHYYHIIPWLGHQHHQISPLVSTRIAASNAMLLQVCLPFAKKQFGRQTCLAYLADATAQLLLSTTYTSTFLGLANTIIIMNYENWDPYHKLLEYHHHTVGKIGNFSDMKKYCCPHWDSNQVPYGYYLT